jgi:Ca2+/Na+ antiporter
VSKHRIAINLVIAAVFTGIVCLVIRRTTENPALRYMSDVMFPIGATVMVLAAIFFLVARDIDGPPMES